MINMFQCIYRIMVNSVSSDDAFLKQVAGKSDNDIKAIIMASIKKDPRSKPGFAWHFTEKYHLDGFSAETTGLVEGLLNWKLKHDPVCQFKSFPIISSLMLKSRDEQINSIRAEIIEQIRLLSGSKELQSSVNLKKS